MKLASLLSVRCSTGINNWTSLLVQLYRGGVILSWRSRGIGSRQLISGSTFRCVERHFHPVFNYRPGKWDNCTRRRQWQSLAIFFVPFFLSLCSIVFFFLFLFGLRPSNFYHPSTIYRRLIRIPQTSWRDCEQLHSFLHGQFPPPDQLFAFAEINRKLRRASTNRDLPLSSQLAVATRDVSLYVSSRSLPGDYCAFLMEQLVVRRVYQSRLAREPGINLNLCISRFIYVLAWIVL